MPPSTQGPALLSGLAEDGGMKCRTPSSGAGHRIGAVRQDLAIAAPTPLDLATCTPGNGSPGAYSGGPAPRADA